MNIMIVDDEKMITDSLVALLQDTGLFRKVVVANNGIEAKNKLKANHYDIIILDINMPKFDGLELVKHIRTETTRTPEIIMMSGQFTPENVQVAADFNIQYTLAKPFNAKKLLEKIDIVSSKIKRAA